MDDGYSHQANPKRGPSASPLDRNNYVAMVAHELRDPLTPILNAAALLLQDPANVAFVQRSAALIDRQARVMSNLIDDLMNISRVQTGKLQLNRSRVGMAEVIRECLEAASPFCDRHGQSLRVTMSPAPMELDADAARLIQTLRNLIVNAAKYSASGTDIHVRAGRDGGDAVVQVIDDGIGIEAADLEPIFSLYVQGANCRLAGANGGLGIGLFLARQFAEAHAGTLRASSPGPGMGSTFTLRIPCLPVETQAAESPAATPSGDPTPASLPRSTRTTAPRDADGREP